MNASSEFAAAQFSYGLQENRNLRKQWPGSRLYVAFFSSESSQIGSVYSDLCSCLHLTSHIGPCPRARLTNDQVMCDEDGNFEPLQCTKNADSSTYLCGCVEPTTGVIVAGTAVEVRSRDDVPDCEDRGKMSVHCVVVMACTQTT